MVSKTIELARKQGYCNVAFEIEKAACFSEVSEVRSRILVVVPKCVESGCILL